MIFGSLIIVNAIISCKLCRCFSIFCSAGSSSALFWSHVWICVGCHLATLVLDDLQCRSCVFLSLTHTHTHTHTHSSCACCWVTWRSPLCTLFPWSFLPFTEHFLLVCVPVMIRHSFRRERKRTWGSMRKVVWRMKWGHSCCSVPLACVSARWQSAQLEYTSLTHPVCYFWSFLITSCNGPCWSGLTGKNQSPVRSWLWMWLMLSLSSI